MCCVDVCICCFEDVYLFLWKGEWWQKDKRVEVLVWGGGGGGGYPPSTEEEPGPPSVTDPLHASLNRLNFVVDSTSHTQMPPPPLHPHPFPHKSPWPRAVPYVQCTDTGSSSGLCMSTLSSGLQRGRQEDTMRPRLCEIWRIHIRLRALVWRITL